MTRARSGSPRSASAQWWVALPIASALVAVAPLIVEGSIVKSYDWALHLFRVQAFAEALAEGTVLPRWIATVYGGWGAPVFVFHPPLAYYVGALPISFGSTPAIALIAVYGTGVLGLGIGAFHWFRTFTTPGRASCGAALLVLLPQILMLAYRFNMPGALLSLAFVPWAWHAVSQLGHRSEAPLRFACALALTLLAHVGTGLELCVLAIVSTLVRAFAEKHLAARIVTHAGLALGLAAALAAIYLLPAFGERHQVHLDAMLDGATTWRRNFVFDRHADPLPGYQADYGFMQWTNGVLLIALVLSGWIAATAKGWREWCRSWLPTGVAALLAFFLMTRVSAGLYEALPVLQSLQFSWRWQPVFAFLTVGAVLHATSPRPRDVASIGALAALVVVTTMSGVLLAPNTFPTLRARAYASVADQRWALARSRQDPLEHRPRAMQEQWARRLDTDYSAPAVVTKGEAKVIDAVVQHARRDVWVTAQTPATLRLKSLCYPGWALAVDGAPAEARCVPPGALAVDVQRGNHHVVGVYRGSGWQRTGAVLSAAGLLVVVLVAVRMRTRSEQPGNG